MRRRPSDEIMAKRRLAVFKQAIYVVDRLEYPMTTGELAGCGRHVGRIVRKMQAAKFRPPQILTIAPPRRASPKGSRQHD